MNFSRVEWEFDYHKGGYLRREGPPCDNWVWSPQGVVNMHVPEMWGYVDFSDVASRFSRRLKLLLNRGLKRRIQYSPLEERFDVAQTVIDPEASTNEYGGAADDVADSGCGG